MCWNRQGGGLTLFCGPQDGFKEGQYWDTLDSYHYVRAAKDKDGSMVLVVGGEDHNTGIKPKDYEVGVSCIL